MFLDGKKLAKQIHEQVKKNIEKYKLRPGLAVILIGQDPGSLIYVKLKQKAAETMGIKFKKFDFPSNAKQKEITNLIKKINKNKTIHGLIIQLPVPKKFNADLLVKTILPKKNVDGFGPGTQFISPVYQAILKLIKQSQIKTRNKKAVILGNSSIFTEPLKCILDKKGLKTQIFYPKKQKFASQTKKADVLVIALGLPYFIKPEMVKRNAVVIDVGYSRVSAKARPLADKGGSPPDRQAGASGGKGKSVGDVDPKVHFKTPYLSPVPGGVGPLTVAYLLRNAYLACKKQALPKGK